MCLLRGYVSTKKTTQYVSIHISPVEQIILCPLKHIVSQSKFLIFKFLKFVHEYNNSKLSSYQCLIRLLNVLLLG